jgi:hypothetical protein
MSFLLRPIVTICLTSLSCVYCPGVVGADRQVGRQSFNPGELKLASTLPRNDATLGLCSDARCVQEDANHIKANLAPTGAQEEAVRESKPTHQRLAGVLAVTYNYAAVTRIFSRISESIAATPEPESLAFFGTGLTIIGAALLCRFRRAKWSGGTRHARHVVGGSSARLARNVNPAQYAARDFRGTTDLSQPECL